MEQEKALQLTKTKQLEIWATSPQQSYKALKVQRISEIFESQTPSINTIKLTVGDLKAKAMVTVFLTELLLQFNVVRQMTVEQVASCVTIILDKYYYWKPEDFKYCFDKILFGKYGDKYRILDRIDTPTILNFLELHDMERTNEAQTTFDKRHEEIKRSCGGMEVHEKVLKAFKDAIPQVDVQTKILPPMKPRNQMSPFELELHKHFKNFEEYHKTSPANKPGDIEPMIEYEGKKMNAPTYVKIMIEKTTGKAL